MYHKASTTRWKSRCQPCLPSSPGSISLSGEGYTSKFTHRAVGRVQSFKGCWTEGLGSLLAVSQGPPSVLAAWTSQEDNSCVPSEGAGERAKEGKQDRASLLIT